MTKASTCVVYVEKQETITEDELKQRLAEDPLC